MDQIAILTTGVVAITVIVFIAVIIAGGNSDK